MNARQDGRQGHWYDPTALAEPENLAEPKPTCVKNSTKTALSSAPVSDRQSRPVRILARVLDAALTLGIVAVLCAAVIGGGMLANAVTVAVLIVVVSALAAVGIAYLWVRS